MSPATFVMPLYSDSARARVYLDEAIRGLYEQTDPDWRLVIVDDGSPRSEDRAHLLDLAERSEGRIIAILQDENRGQGACRNVGIRHAAQSGSDIILFHDADDISHPRRLDLTRQVLDESPEVDFVYSTFIVIDESGRTVPTGALTPSVSELLHTHWTAPVHGPDAWIRMGTETAYTTLTSTVAVRTELALEHPFAEIRGSEDMHTWFRMSAGGNHMAFIPSIPTLYRVPQDGAGSSDRDRIGGDYYRRKADHDRDGFYQAIDIALRRGRIHPTQVAELKERFLQRLAWTMLKENQHEIAYELLIEGRAESELSEPSKTGTLA